MTRLPHRQRILAALFALPFMLACLGAHGTAAAQETTAQEAPEADDGQLPENPFQPPADSADPSIDSPEPSASSAENADSAGGPSDASNTDTQPEPEAAPTWEVRGSLDWISAGRWVSPADTSANPGNEVFRIAQLGAQSELRPKLRLDYGSWLTGVAQPRFLTGVDLTDIHGAWQPPSARATASILQLYASWQVKESFTLAYGFQNFQWGPAELLSPSNRVFPVVNFQRDPLFVVPGRNMVRANISAGKSVSLVLLAEVLPSRQATFQARDRFQPQGLAKLEYMQPDGSSYLGVTSGVGNHSRPWLGEYGSFSLTDALALYCDASHTQGSRAFRPRQKADVRVEFVKPWARSDRVRTLADCGTSFAFEQGTELRVEYLYNDAGYSVAELRDAKRAVTHLASRAASADAYMAPGLQLLAKQAVFVSIRVPELFSGKRVTVVTRYLWSATDHSGSGFAVISINASDALVLFASAIATHGPSYGEHSRLISSGVVAGATYSM